MKITLFFLFLFQNSYSQDTLKLKQIDLLVSRINASALPVLRDTINQDYHELGLKMTTYQTMIIDSNTLIKYVNHVNTTMTENGTEKQTITSSSFYYDHSNLVKVEEYLIEGDINKEAAWYYSDDKPLYFSLQSDTAEERALLLLTIAKAMLKRVCK